MNGFALWIGLGASLGLAWVALRAERSAKASPRRVRRLVNAGLALMVGALIGGRMAYVTVNWGYFYRQPLEIPQVWLGGLAWAGVIAGGLVGLGIFALWAKASPAALADHLIPLVLMLTISSWLACWNAGCAYGQLSNAWWAVPAIDEWGEVAMRVPIQPGAAVLTLLAFWILEAFQPHLRRPGQAASLALLFLAAELLMVSFLRADPAPRWQNLRLDSWAGIFFLGLSILFFIITFFSVPAKRLETLDSNHLS